MNYQIHAKIEKHRERRTDGRTDTHTHKQTPYYCITTSHTHTNRKTLKGLYKRNYNNKYKRERTATFENKTKSQRNPIEKKRVTAPKFGMAVALKRYKVLPTFYLFKATAMPDFSAVSHPPFPLLKLLRINNRIVV